MSARPPPLPPLSPLLAGATLLLLLVSPSGCRASARRHQAARSVVRCLSCMNTELERHWSSLQDVYARPANFTDTCIDLPGGGKHIGLVECRRSVCVTVIEPRMLAGHVIGQNYIRGCLRNMFVYEREILQVHVDDTCRPTTTRRLLGDAHLDKTTSPSEIYVCYCLGNRCNNNSLNGSNSSRRPPSHPFAALPSLLLLIISSTRHVCASPNGQM